jgi:UDP-glucose-4-epimerase GalE
VGTGKVLVTGGAGYVGAHTVHHLIAGGARRSDIVVFDSLERGHAGSIPQGVELIRGDLRSTADVAAAFRRHEFAAVLHFAAYAYVGESMQLPGRYFHNNIAGGLNLLDAAREAGCAKLVFSSTCAVYGSPRSLPITEEFPSAPESPYGESKRCFEDLLAWYARLHRVRSISLRYFNAAGAGYGIGERHEPETHLIPLALKAALGGGEPLTIHGADYDTPDGTCIRDYVHVLDLADAHVKALQALESGSIEHERVNLGTGAGASVREVVKVVEEVSGRRLPVTVGPRRAGDPPRLFADATRARQLLGWTAQRDLRAMVRDAWAWHRRFEALVRTDQ